MRRARLAACALVLLATAAAPAIAAESDPRTRADTQRALGLQYELGSDLGMIDAPWVGTHNSFNSIAEMGLALSPLDSNQRLTIRDQLDLGMRSLELDVHSFPALREGRLSGPIVCHATGPHIGCTIEKGLGPVLEEIGDWLEDNRDQVLLLYLEDRLDGRAEHEAAAAMIERELGPVLARPDTGRSGCGELPPDLTREAVRARGDQVIVVSKCGQGPGWPRFAFDWSDREEERPIGYEDYPACDPDIDRATYRAKLIRYYEDSTQLTRFGDPLGISSADEGVTPTTAGRLARCGVDLIGLDQLVVGDPRLPELVWSWAPGEPTGGDCSLRGGDGRWRSHGCNGTRPAACRKRGGGWELSRPVRAGRAQRACRRIDAVHAVPRTGYENERLGEAAAGRRPVWLGQRRAAPGRWRSLDER